MKKNKKITMEKKRFNKNNWHKFIFLKENKNKRKKKTNKVHTGKKSKPLSREDLRH